MKKIISIKNNNSNKAKVIFEKKKIVSHKNKLNPDWEEFGFVLTDDDRKIVLNYFEKILQNFTFKLSQKNLVFITVNHFVSTLPPFLASIRLCGKIGGVIKKGAIPDKRIIKYITAKKYGAPNIDKEKLKQPKLAKEFLLRTINPNEKCIIMDIGGYFAPVLKLISNDEELRKRILGIVEDTENGHQKYEKVIKDSKIPIFSVAQSEQKKMEDYNVGKSIVVAADMILREVSTNIIERMKEIAVIGFGKIGQGIAEHLRQKNINIYIHEIDPIRRNIASSLGFNVVEREKIFTVPMIFCATGQKCMSGDDFFKCRDNVFIASCTSADDELDISLLETTSKEVVRGNINTFTFKTSRINLLCRGNAVNFAFGGVNGPFIYAVQAAIMACAANIANNYSSLSTNIINTLTKDEEKRIAALWSKSFDQIKPDIFRLSQERNKLVKHPVDIPDFLANIKKYKAFILSQIKQPTSFIANQSQQISVSQSIANTGNIQVLVEDGTNPNVGVNKVVAEGSIQIASVKKVTKENVDNFFKK